MQTLGQRDRRRELRKVIAHGQTIPMRVTWGANIRWKKGVVKRSSQGLRINVGPLDPGSLGFPLQDWLSFPEGARAWVRPGRKMYFPVCVCTFGLNLHWIYYNISSVSCFGVLFPLFGWKACELAHSLYWKGEVPVTGLPGTSWGLLQSYRVGRAFIFLRSPCYLPPSAWMLILNPHGGYLHRALMWLDICFAF